MNVKVWIKYEESYLPPRCRKPHYKECEEHIDLALPEAALSDMRLAFEDLSYEGARKIYSYKDRLWRLATRHDPFCWDEDGKYSPLENMIRRLDTCSSHFRFAWDRTEHGQDTSREAVVRDAEKDLQEFLLVDGELYTCTAEPRYCIYTFGLGHNHGGSALSVDYHYNSNISKSRYFSALQGQEAVEEATRIALGRGDTESVQYFKEYIVVYAPDLVKINPQEQHGEGDPFLNKLNAITEVAPDTLTAGLLCIASMAGTK